MDQRRRVLSNAMWEQLESALEGARDARGARGSDERAFIEAVLYLARTGCPWRDLPDEFGTWSTVYMRFRRWEETGVWRTLWERLEQGACPGALRLFIDSTSVPVHPHAAGAPKKTAAERLLAARGAA